MPLFQDYEKLLIIPIIPGLLYDFFFLQLIDTYRKAENDSAEHTGIWTVAQVLFITFEFFSGLDV